jgi:hypothetical protein
MSKRVPSPAQSDASRQNGSKSQGPVTPDGKSRSSRNGIRHGFLANTVLLETESRDRFMALCADLDQHFEPATEIEAGLIETMAVCRWRQMRLWSMERAALAHEIEKRSSEEEDTPTRVALAFHTLCENSRAGETLNRYESRYDRQYNRALQSLNQIRQKRDSAHVA